MNEDSGEKDTGMLNSFIDFEKIQIIQENLIRDF